MSENTRRVTNRFSLAAPRLEGRTYEEARFEIQQWIEHTVSILDSLATRGDEGGLDPLAGLIVPEPIEAGDVGAIGNPGLGFAPIDHEHPVTTGTPIGLANSNVQGTSIALPRADHQHKRDVRVQSEDVDVGTRNAVNFEDSGDVDFAFTDEAGPDKVTVKANLTAGALLRPHPPTPHTHHHVDIVGGNDPILAAQVFGP